MTGAPNGQVDYFGRPDQAKNYAKFRPEYSSAIAEYVLSQAKDFETYVDVACGSGQLTYVVAPKFKHSTGIDRSDEQLSFAASKRPSGIAPEKVLFSKGDAFHLPVESHSVSLLTVAQALHWLVPIDRFLTEVKRVLKPNGVFVAIGYTYPFVEDARARKICDWFYYDLLGASKQIGEPGCYWDTDREIIDSKYASLTFPFASVKRHEIKQTLANISVEHYINYYRSYSAYNTYLARGNPDILPQMQRDIESALVKKTMDVTHTFFLVSCSGQ